MRDLYRDTNTGFESYIEKLTDPEGIAFTRGFEAALLVVVDKIVDTKSIILDKYAGTENESYGKELLARIHMLDLIEKDLNGRINVLDAEVSLPPLL